MRPQPSSKLERNRKFNLSNLIENLNPSSRARCWFGCYCYGRPCDKARCCRSCNRWLIIEVQIKVVVVLDQIDRIGGGLRRFRRESHETRTLIVVQSCGETHDGVVVVSRKDVALNTTTRISAEVWSRTWSEITRHNRLEHILQRDPSKEAVGLCNCK